MMKVIRREFLTKSLKFTSALACCRLWPFSASAQGSILRPQSEVAVVKSNKLTQITGGISLVKLSTEKMNIEKYFNPSCSTKSDFSEDDNAKFTLGKVGVKKVISPMRIGIIFVERNIVNKRRSHNGYCTRKFI